MTESSGDLNIEKIVITSVRLSKVTKSAPKFVVTNLIFSQQTRHNFKIDSLDFYMKVNLL